MDQRCAQLRICAVVVTYRPDPAKVATTLAAVAGEVAASVIIDNTPQPVPDLPGPVVRPGTNIGLAAAQNRGIDWAREQGCTHVLLLDQDSVPQPSMVTALATALGQLENRQRVAAVGPVFDDARDHRPAPFVRVGFPMSRKLFCTGANEPIECDFLISSGSLIPLAVLDDVGPMAAELFIDNIDLEWSFRARARGYTLFGVCGAHMTHALGDDRVRVFGVPFVTHSPSRLYYMMRNRVRLYGLAHTPRVWVAQDLPRVLVKLVLFAVFIGPRATNLRHMARGLLDGVRRRSGPCPLGAS